MSDILSTIAADLDRCNKCGFCMAGCPTYQTQPMEWFVTRGRISLIQDVLAGRLNPDDPGYRQAIDSCLQCRACVPHCPPAMPIDKVITRARAAIKERHGMSLTERAIYRGLLARPGLMKAAVRAGHLAEKAGLRRWAMESGVLKRWPVLQRAAETGPSLPETTGRALIAAERAREAAATPIRDRVVYFLGCSKDLLYPKAALATYRVLRRNGVAVEVPDSVCCGLPNNSAGDLAGARALARRNLELLRSTSGPIVVDESSCGSHLAHLAALFEGMPEEQEFRAFGERVVDLTVYLDRLGIETPGPLPGRVAWHHPCHLRHHIGETQAPLRLLRKVPEATLVEWDDEGGCCGGAGSIMLTQPELSDGILERRMKALAGSRAEILVTGSPSCITQYSRARGGPRVMYLSEYLELAYGRKNGGS